MKVLFIGGNGNISWWCVEEAIRKGYEVYELNRRMTRTTRRAVQPEVHQIVTDIRDEDQTRAAIGELEFDVVCDFICFNQNQAEKNIGLFEDKTAQYIVISSEAVYRRESRYLPFKENTPRYDININDSYIAGKIAVENAFRDSFEKEGFPVTIVRPGYTYDTIIQMPVGQNCFTAPQKIMEGYPFLMPGDGENLVAPLHSKDFARAYIGLVGNKNAIGEDYHIAAEKLITWNEMAEDIMAALGVENGRILHIPRDEAVNITSFYSEIVNRQHMWHYIFDITKIRNEVSEWNQTIDFSDGIRETVSWLFEDKARVRINQGYGEKLEAIYDKYWTERN